MNHPNSVGIEFAVIAKVTIFNMISNSLNSIYQAKVANLSIYQQDSVY
jgi:hypothetical protein